MNTYKWNDIEHDEDEQMENEEYVKEIEMNKVKKRSLCKVIGGLLIFGSGVVVGHVSDSMVIGEEIKSRELKEFTSQEAADFMSKHVEGNAQGMKEFYDLHPEELKKLQGLVEDKGVPIGALQQHLTENEATYKKAGHHIKAFAKEHGEKVMKLLTDPSKDHAKDLLKAVGEHVSHHHGQ